MSLQPDGLPLRVPAEDELAALRSELFRLQDELAAERHARGEAERSAALKDEVLTVVAHELRAPLGAIVGWVHLLREGGGEDALDRGLDVIEQSAQAQLKLVEDLLVMGRMASGRVRLQCERMDLAALAAGVVESIRPDARAREIDLRADAAGDVPVLADPTRMRQVLWNLLANALKFTPAGGTVDVTVRAAAGDVLVTVRDTGCGIAPAFLPHVFERFRQEPGTRAGHSGLGIGLAIARHLVELHGGRIGAASEGEGRGATFTVRLPLAKPDA